ncbi:GAF domain-containing protein [Gemmatimonas sp.]|uniref:GAF domain-containing protein n=1 Tax=Gemmatimonas sp. TaxID=1962908 RepID=UPI00398360AE
MLPQRIPDLLTRLVRDLANSTLTTRALYERLAETARELVEASSACVLELTEQGVRVVAPTGVTPLVDGSSFPMAQAPSLCREVLDSRRARGLNDGANDLRVDPCFRQSLEVRQLALAPILLAGDVTGLLACINTAHDGFTDAHLALLELVAAYGAMVMRSSALVRQAEAAANDARARAEDAARAANVNAILVKTARSLADATTPAALYDGLADILVQKLRADGFAVYAADPQLKTARFEHQWGVASFARTRIESAFWRTRLGDVVLSATPMFIEDLTAESNLDDIGRALVDAGVYALALLPLVLEERAQGVLAIRYLGARRFDDGERELLTNLATQVALAFRNMVLMGELECRADRFALLARAQQQLTQLTSEESLPQAIAEAVHLVIPCDAIDVLAIGAEGLQRVLRMQAGQVISTDPVTITKERLATSTAQTGVPRLASHLSAGPDVARGTMELCAAVRFGQRSAGVIRLLGAKRDAFVMQDLDLLTIIARHAGTAVETARLFTLQEFQRQRAEGAAELARVTLQAVTLADGATELLEVLDRFVPSIGKAIGVARARDGHIEYVAASGTLDVFKGQRPAGSKGVNDVAPDGRPTELSSLRDVAPASVADSLPDEWALAVPLTARDRSLGILLVTAPRTAPLRPRDRITLERLSASLALALDALLLDEEERLAREREQLLATALTTIDHPIFILDRVGVRYANPAAAREYGWSQVELMEMQFEQLVAGHDSREGMREADGLLEAGVSLSHDVHWRRDGSDFPAAVTVSPLAGHDGELLGQVVSVRNVSQDRRLEEQLRHTEKMVALGELVAGVAHEINNPLTGISAFAQILLEEDLGDDQRESVQLIKQESDRAKTVIKDLLLFARTTERGAGPVNINEVIEQTVRLRAYPLRNAGVQVELQLDPTAPRISGDSQTLQQVLLNVFGNAEHAMRDREVRRLVVRTRRDDDCVIITAVDTGVGMTADVRRRIFEPFYTTKPAGVGTGLGLSVSYGIIHAHGGTIGVESEPNVGSTVTIVLPAMPPDHI